MGSLLIAEDLLMGCLSRRPESVVAIDVPEHHVAFAEPLRRFEFQSGFTTARMYRGDVSPISLAGIYGITTLELG